MQWHRDASLNLGISAIIVRCRDVVALQIVAFDEGGINDLRTAQIDGQVRVTIGSLSVCREISVNDVAGIGSARERYRYTSVQCFRFR